MFCPRCGTENDAGNRFCVSCGAEMSKLSSGAPAEKLSLGQRLQHLIGTSRRARLLSAATAAAIVIAIIAFAALKPKDDNSIPQDAYLRTLDASCVEEKERVSSLELETLATRPPNVEEFAADLVRAVTEWRLNIQSGPPPSVHAEGVAVLEAALLNVLIEAGALARVTRDGAPARAIAGQAQAIDAATAEVDRAIQTLGLSRCNAVTVRPAAPG
jgi:hypothetical protein